MTNPDSAKVINEHKSVLPVEVIEHNFGFSEKNSSISFPANSFLYLRTTSLFKLKNQTPTKYCVLLLIPCGNCQIEFYITDRLCPNIAGDNQNAASLCYSENYTFAI